MMKWLCKELPPWAERKASWTSKLPRLWLLLGLFVVVAVLIGWVRWLPFSAPSIEHAYGFKVLDTHFAFDPQAAANGLKGIDGEVRQAYLLFEAFDFIFLVSYAIALCGAIHALVRSRRGPAPWQLVWVPVAAAIADLVEDGLITSALLSGATPSLVALEVARWAGVVKYVLFIAALVTPLLLLVDHALQTDGSQKEYDREDGVRQTYFSLRLALTLLVTLLFATLFIHAAPPWCWLRSVSAYYYSALNPMFVGILVAVGICLIVYQGTTYIENVLLDIAGFMAFIVAFVPTELRTDETCQASIIGSGDARSQIVGGNVYPLLGVTVLATTITLISRYRRPRSDASRTGELWRLRIGLSAQIVILVLLCTLRDQFENRAHEFAAVMLFTCIIAVVWSNHLGRTNRTDVQYKLPKNIYAWVAAVMGLTLLFCVSALYLYDWPHWIIGVELALIAEFAVFWAIQTGDLQGKANRVDQAAE